MFSFLYLQNLGWGVIAPLALPLPAPMPASKKAACWHFPISWLLSRPQRPAHVAATAETAEISITSVVEFEGSWSDIYNLDFMISLGDYIKIDRKWMLLLNDPFWPFFVLFKFIIHKTEVQPVSLRCSANLNPNLFKS